MPAAYRIVATDCDGTLLNGQHRVSEHTKDVMRQLVNSGRHLVLATGRHPVDVELMCNTLGIRPYTITANGACIRDPDCNYILEKNLEPAIIKQLLRGSESKDPEVVLGIYWRDLWMLNRFFPEPEGLFALTGFDFKYFDPHVISPEGVRKFSFRSTNIQKLQDIELKYRAIFGDSVNIAFSAVDCLDFMARGVSKGTALEFVAASLGCQLEDCIAFGDGMNDLEMLTVAGKGCVMQNASQRLKAALPHIEVVGTNDKDAVAEKVAALFGFYAHPSKL